MCERSVPSFERLNHGVRHSRSSKKIASCGAILPESLAVFAQYSRTRTDRRGTNWTDGEQLAEVSMRLGGNHGVNGFTRGRLTLKRRQRGRTK
jgi:hypothetical protein